MIRSFNESLNLKFTLTPHPPLGIPSDLNKFEKQNRRKRNGPRQNETTNSSPENCVKCRLVTIRFV